MSKQRFQQTLTLTGAYALGDVLHGAIEFTSPDPNGTVYLLSISDNEKKNAEIDVFLIRKTAALSGTYTDNAAPTVNAADTKNAFVQTFLSSDYRDFNSHSVATKTGKAIVNVEPSDRLFVVLVLKQAITWASGDSLTLNMELL